MGLIKRLLSKLISGIKLIALIFISVSVLVVIGSKTMSSKQNNMEHTTKTTMTDEQRLTEAVAEAEANAKRAVSFEFQRKIESTVRNTLKDPDSAIFKDFYISSKNAGCGLVNAKNSFNAYSGFARYISDGNNVLIEGTDKNFKSSWKKYCQ